MVYCNYIQSYVDLCYMWLSTPSPPNIGMREVDGSESHQTPGAMPIRLSVKSKVIFLEFHKHYHKDRPPRVAINAANKKHKN